MKPMKPMMDNVYYLYINILHKPPRRPRYFEGKYWLWDDKDSIESYDLTLYNYTLSKFLKSYFIDLAPELKQ
jgi:hypothetical protein